MTKNTVFAIFRGGGHMVFGGHKEVSSNWPGFGPISAIIQVVPTRRSLIDQNPVFYVRSLRLGELKVGEMFCF